METVRRLDWYLHDRGELRLMPTEQKIIVETPHLMTMGLTFYGNFFRGACIGAAVGFFGALALVAVSVAVLKLLM